MNSRQLFIEATNCFLAFVDPERVPNQHLMFNANMQITYVEQEFGRNGRNIVRCMA